MADEERPGFIEVRLNPAALRRHGLPDILYPLPLDALDAALGQGDDLPFPIMLHALQQASAVGDADWQGYEPAMVRIAELVAPEDDRSVVSAAGDNWWIEVGPVDLTGPIVTLQRGDHLIAAMARREDGRLRLAAYRPLDARSARLIISVALRPHPEDGTVCMRPNNWEYALDCSAGSGQWYACDRGEAYLSCWTRGLGLQGDGNVEQAWAAMVSLPQRPPAEVAIELGVAYALS